MQLQEISFNNPVENLVYDAFLLHQAEKHQKGEFLRFWESPVYFIVLGRAGKIAVDVNIDMAKRDGVGVWRRSSGGGTVLQGPGCLNFSLVLSKKRHDDIADLGRSYRWVSRLLIDAMAKQGIAAQFYPISDLATPQGKKFSGNAQQRAKEHILHHGTLLYGFDLFKVSQYLLMPQDQPEYRRGRLHADFITNIALDLIGFKQEMMRALHISHQTTSLTSDQQQEFQDFMQEKQSSFLIEY